MENLLSIIHPQEIGDVRVGVIIISNSRNDDAHGQGFYGHFVDSCLWTDEYSVINITNMRISWSTGGCFSSDLSHLVHRFRCSPNDLLYNIQVHCQQSEIVAQFSIHPLRIGGQVVMVALKTRALNWISEEITTLRLEIINKDQRVSYWADYFGFTVSNHHHNDHKLLQWSYCSSTQAVSRWFGALHTYNCRSLGGSFCPRGHSQFRSPAIIFRCKLYGSHRQLAHSFTCLYEHGNLTAPENGPVEGQRNYMAMCRQTPYCVQERFVAEVGEGEEEERTSA